MAQLLRSQDGYDPIKNTHEWQSRQLNIQPSDYIDETPEHDEFARLSANLLALFKEVVLALPEQTIPKDARISLERSCSALILWSDGYGIAQGRLNDTFKKSGKLRHALFKSLSHIGRVLTERLVPLADISSEKLQMLCLSVESNIEDAGGINNEELCQQSDDSSSDAGSAFSDDNIYEIAEDLKTDTCVLSGLDPLIKYPIFDFQQENVVGDYVHSAWGPEKFFADKIENRFPRVDVSLASRLGKTNFERYLRCQTDRDAVEKEENIHLTQHEGPELAGTIIADSTFHDSGIGTSIAPTMTYAETIMSYSHEGQSVRVPPLPKEAKEGLPFSCIACGRTVVITNNSAWKRHIYLDLQPYMCLDISCPFSSTTFESREKWISHLALDHEMEPKWDSIECLLCKEETGNGKLAVTRHFSKHLEEISLSALPVEVDSNVASENGSERSDDSDCSISVSKEHSGQNQEGFTNNDDDLSPQYQSLLPDASLLDYKGKSTSTAVDSSINEELNRNFHRDQKEISKFLDMLRAHCVNQPDTYDKFCDILVGLKGARYLTAQEIDEAVLLFHENPNLERQFGMCSLDGLRANVRVGSDEKPDPYGPRSMTLPGSPNRDVSKPTITSRLRSGLDEIVRTISTSSDINSTTQLSLQLQILQQQRFLQQQFGMNNPSAMAAIRQQQQALTAQQTAAELTVTEANDIPPRPINDNSPAEDMQKQKAVGFGELESEWVNEEYLAKVKSRFINKPHIYRHLLRIIRSLDGLHGDQSHAKLIQAVLKAVRQLFGSNSDLIIGFETCLMEKLKKPRQLTRESDLNPLLSSQQRSLQKQQQYIQAQKQVQQNTLSADNSSKIENQGSKFYQNEELHGTNSSISTGMMTSFTSAVTEPLFDQGVFFPQSDDSWKTTKLDNDLYNTALRSCHSDPLPTSSLSFNNTEWFTTHAAEPLFDQGASDFQRPGSPWKTLLLDNDGPIGDDFLLFPHQQNAPLESKTSLSPSPALVEREDLNVGMKSITSAASHADLLVKAEVQATNLSRSQHHESSEQMRSTRLMPETDQMSSRLANDAWLLESIRMIDSAEMLSTAEMATWGQSNENEVNELTMKMMARATDQQKTSTRLHAQSKLTAEKFVEFVATKRDPLVWWFKKQAIQAVKASSVNRSQQSGPESQNNSQAATTPLPALISHGPVIEREVNPHYRDNDHGMTKERPSSHDFWIEPFPLELNTSQLNSFYIPSLVSGGEQSEDYGLIPKYLPGNHVEVSKAYNESRAAEARIPDVLRFSPPLSADGVRQLIPEEVHREGKAHRLAVKEERHEDDEFQRLLDEALRDAPHRERIPSKLIRHGRGL